MFGTVALVPEMPRTPCYKLTLRTPRAALFPALGSRSRRPLFARSDEASLVKKSYAATTAASVWLVAAIGMATAGGLYLPAVGTTALGLGILAAMESLEQRLGAARRSQVLAIGFDRRRTSPLA